jgi:hypothetical protein
MTVCSSKIVVFDLDETLGYFTQLGIFWDALKSYIKYKNIKQLIDDELFNDLLDLYPEYLRPNIIDILKYLKHKKKKNHCDKLIVYTNNQGPLEWGKHIIKYFETKINYKIFDKIIGAYKINGKTVELCRTTHLKTHNDLIKCTKISDKTQICFLDDVYYPDMNNDNIYYINLKPYIYDLDFNEMISRFINSNIINSSDLVDFNEYMLVFINKYNYIFVKKEPLTLNIDKIISKKILQHLHIFFNIKRILTKKIKIKRNHNKTSKNY